MRNDEDINFNQYTTSFKIIDTVKDQQEGLGLYSFLLGRWSLKWQEAQQLYFNIIETKKSSLWWTTAIISKTLYMVWDIWDFCHQITYGNDGPGTVQHHLQLNRSIREQFIEGSNNLLQSDQHMMKNHYFDSLHKKTPFAKKS